MVNRFIKIKEKSFLILVNNYKTKFIINLIYIIQYNKNFFLIYNFVFNILLNIF